MMLKTRHKPNGSSQTTVRSIEERPTATKFKKNENADGAAAPDAV